MPTEGESAEGRGLIRDTVRFSAATGLGLLAGLALQLFTLAFLGHLGGPALFARAVYTPVGFLALAVTEGLVVAAQIRAGIRRREGHSEIASPFRTYGILGGAVLVLVALTFAAGQDLVFALLGVGLADRPGVAGFVVAMCLASAVALLPYLAGAVLRGSGRAAASAGLSVGFTLLAVAATLVLGAVTGLGMLAVPAGTALAALLTLVPLPRVLAASPSWPEVFADVRAFGLPVAATFLMLSFVSAGYLRVLRDAGPADLAGFGLAQNASGFVLVAALAIGSGAAVAANLRPGPDRRPIAAAGLKIALRLVIPVYGVIGALTFVAREPMARLFTSDPAAAAVTADYFAWNAPTFLLYGGTLTLLSYLEQTGRARAAMTLNAAYFAVLLGVAFALPQPVTAGTLTKLLAVSNVIGYATCRLSAHHLLIRTKPAGPEDGTKDEERRYA